MWMVPSHSRLGQLLNDLVVLGIFEHEVEPPWGSINSKHVLYNRACKFHRGNGLYGEDGDEVDGAIYLGGIYK